MALIRVHVQFNRGQQAVVAPGIIDTGAEGFAFLDASIARKIGLTQSGPGVPYVGVGGGVNMGFKAEVDNMLIVDNPECSLPNIKVLVGDMSHLRDIKVLVGEDFLKSVKAKLEADEKGFSVACKEGVHVAIPEKMKMEHMLLMAGIGALTLITGIALFSARD